MTKALHGEHLGMFSQKRKRLLIMLNGSCKIPNLKELIWANMFLSGMLKTMNRLTQYDSLRLTDGIFKRRSEG